MRAWTGVEVSDIFHGRGGARKTAIVCQAGQPVEVAALVAWLASDECSFSTGGAFDLSGGSATYLTFPATVDHLSESNPLLLRDSC
jgi:hypothetical protein